MANITVDQGTQSPIYTENAGTVEIGAVKIDLSAAGTYGVSMFRGTIQQVNNLGTIPNIPGGTIGVVSSVANLAAGTVTKLEGGTLGLVTRVGNVGTLEVGTITALPNTPGGTLGLVTRVSTIGTLEVGTISSLPNLPQGSINVTAGTIATLGTMGTLGLVNTVTNLTSGSVRMTVGTVTVLPNTPGGTLDQVTTVSNLTTGSVRITVGTITVLPNIPGGTVDLVTTVSNLTNGSVRMTVGTVTTGSIAVTAGTVSAGTINTGTVNAGTINTGTINVGTVTEQPYPAAQVLSAGTTTAGTIGTLITAPGAGTGIYINSLSINALSGTPEIVLSYALQAAGNQVVNRGAYAVGGGIANAFPHPSYYGTAAAALTWNLLANVGTVSIAVTYTTKGTP
jgi:hypothetical protein